MRTASELVAALEDLADPQDVDYVARFYKGGDPATEVMGVRMPKVFPIAKQFATMHLDDVAALLDDDRYEVRMAAVAIMDFQARRKKLDVAHREALFDLYLRRHDRLNNWDFVDRAAPHVIGEYLVDKDRSVLHRLARSVDPHERRTALVATHAFIKRGEVGDTFRIAEILAADTDDYVQKAIGSWVREAGKLDEAALMAFLSSNKERLPKTTITAAAKHLSQENKNELRSR
ncbi:DNA alkylation repair protein [Roseinatronobacter alkalisoli]|uniref:DNA alkylation repair protein n=1 Tax=Roseinatronobacter alkalisoli TaxID=3028235 RepID=A0ABT5TF08_9RHOB|nr:DNA alkylation repair protein [Roseinatronobacter sp. HJB301]MDD7973695.1 DNA alkylation repair protein [Roseinatronobacter sp. HJB301]